MSNQSRLDDRLARLAEPFPTEFAEGEWHLRLVEHPYDRGENIYDIDRRRSDIRLTITSLKHELSYAVHAVVDRQKVSACGNAWTQVIDLPEEAPLIRLIDAGHAFSMSSTECMQVDGTSYDLWLWCRGSSISLQGFELTLDGKWSALIDAIQNASEPDQESGAS